ncbi:hypothetical protein RRG08_004482 [Elysia crispata]|uniref:Uncharacterized protein n=1 Tax=Elysia crispata TaxID=231223 RepID=A0AAE1B9T1_9GAST|nr:hypothetical protein RRG08_004482 [Elysia crispata]
MYNQTLLSWESKAPRMFPQPKLLSYFPRCPPTSTHPEIQAQTIYLVASGLMSHAVVCHSEHEQRPLAHAIEPESV